MDKEKALELVKELLELEEKNDIGTLTRKERAEFQDIVLELFEEKEANRISINTPEGRMEAGFLTDPDYPGIYIELYPNGKDYAVNLSIAEYNGEEEVINLYSYGDATQEDYTSKETLLSLF